MDINEGRPRKKQVRVYPDHMIWVNRLIGKITPSAFRDALARGGLSLRWGFENVYEAGKNFLTPNGKERGIFQFNFLSGIGPEGFMRPFDDLLADDIRFARTGVRSSRLLGMRRSNLVQSNLRTCASGSPPDEMVSYIRRREEAIRLEAPTYRERILTANVGSEAWDFASTKDNAEIRRAILAGSKWSRPAGDVPLEALSERRHLYPVLNTFVDASLFQNYLALHTSDGPGRKLGDYMHLLNAAGTDVLVTDDGKLTKRAPALCPGLRVVSGDTFCEWLSSGTVGLG